jgi:hypothetical protein
MNNMRKRIKNNKLTSAFKRIGFKIPKSRTKQHTLVFGLILILSTCTLTYLYITNPNFYTKEYSEPFRDWLFSYQGRKFLLLYFSVILLLIIVSSSKVIELIKRTFHTLGKKISKLKPPRIKTPSLPRLSVLDKAKSKFAFRYSPARNNKRKKRILVLAWVVIILTPLVVFSLTNHSEVRAWWNDSWQYRKKLTITNAGSEQTDFQVAINLNTSTLISSGNMRSDCSDIRIFDFATNNLIADPYYVSGCNSSYTLVTIKFATVPVGDTVLFMYYGNSQATNSFASQGDDVFEFFDDFNDNSIDTAKWNYSDPGSGLTTSETSQVMRRSGTTSAGNQTNTLTSDDTFDNFRVEEYRIRINSASGTELLMYGYNSSYAVLRYDGGTIKWQYWGGSSWIDIGTSTVTVGGGWYNIKLVAESTGLSIYENGSYRGKRSVTIGSGNSTNNFGGRVWVSGNSFSFDVDNTIIRQYDASEPTFSFGSEEFTPGPVAHWKFDEGYSETLEQPLTTNEQQINIVTQVYSHTSTSNYPTDNSLGRVRWDADRFPGATVYFEAMIRNTGTAGYYQSWASLYTTGGSQVSGSEVTMGNRVGGTTYQYLRSGAITLTDDTDYTVRMRRQDGTGVEIKAARLIVVQSDSDGITDTETQIELGATEKQASSTYTQLTDKKIYYYDSSKFTPAPTTYFEATLRNSQPTIEQQLNIVTQVYSHTSTSNYPTDNSLGRVRWDADRFPGATVYFEAVIRSTGTAGYYQSWASLYSAGGSQVSGSEVTLCNRCGGPMIQITQSE